jgi:hypothetical protein
MHTDPSDIRSSYTSLCVYHPQRIPVMHNTTHGTQPDCTVHLHNARLPSQRVAPYYSDHIVINNLAPNYSNMHNQVFRTLCPPTLVL